MYIRIPYKRKTYELTYLNADSKLLYMTFDTFCFFSGRGYFGGITRVRGSVVARLKGESVEDKLYTKSQLSHSKVCGVLFWLGMMSIPVSVVFGIAAGSDNKENWFLVSILIALMVYLVLMILNKIVTDYFIIKVPHRNGWTLENSPSQDR